MDGAVDLELSFWETMVNTWIVMAVLVLGAWLVSRRLRVDPPFSRLQHVAEVLVVAIKDQIEDICGGSARPYIPFVGTLFLFILAANALSLLPDLGGSLFGFALYYPPTAVLETTTALALTVFFAVPIYTIALRGVRHWLRGYIEPTPLMLPFNIIGDVSRTLALAVRLLGNMMSGVVLVGILLSIAPFFFPIVLQLFGLLTGSIQAYIFAILSMVYIASAVQVTDRRQSGAKAADGPAGAGSKTNGNERVE